MSGNAQRCKHGTDRHKFCDFCNNEGLITPSRDIGKYPCMCARPGQLCGGLVDLRGGKDVPNNRADI